MPTDEERRKIAAELRELPIDMYEVKERWETEGLDTLCEEQTDYYLIHHAVSGCFPAEHMHLCDYEELHDRLADLIEPEERTCRVIMKWDGLDGRDPVCSKCGAYFDDKKWHEQKFCPYCGARVIHDA